jgi:hypothetical protein
VGDEEKENIAAAADWCVFFGKAFDLVMAYRGLAHQIFEPNVRCELWNSKINHSINERVFLGYLEANSQSGHWLFF